MKSCSFATRSRRGAVWVGLVVLAVVAGCARRPRLVFDVTSDMLGSTPPEHTGFDSFEGACETIRELGGSEFMILAGDFSPPERVRATLDRTLGAAYRWYPVVGNHEYDRPEYVAYVREQVRAGRLGPLLRTGPGRLAQTCYSFDAGPAHFVAIDQYADPTGDQLADGDVGDAVYAWLAEDLAATRQPYVFVIGHEPVAAEPDLDNGQVRHATSSLNKHPAHAVRFWKLLRSHGVTAYICGHTHKASLARINGVWQIDAGHCRGSGRTPSTFVRVTIDSGGVRCCFYRLRRGDSAPAYVPAYAECLTTRPRCGPRSPATPEAGKDSRRKGNYRGVEP